MHCVEIIPQIRRRLQKRESEVVFSTVGLPIHRFLEDLDIRDVVLAQGQFFRLKDVLAFLADRDPTVLITDLHGRGLLVLLAIFKEDGGDLGGEETVL